MGNIVNILSHSEGWDIALKHEKISIKWKIFCYLLAFTVILLVVLWLIQICYLDAFYKSIRSREADTLISKAIAVLEEKEDSDTIETELEELAAKSNAGIFVTDTEGNKRYCVEYVPMSHLSEMSTGQIEKYYKQAKENGGSVKIEYLSGWFNKSVPDLNGPSPQKSEPLSGIEEADERMQMQDDKAGGLMRNHGKGQVESVIYIHIVTIAGEELLLMVNTQLSPVDATVNTLRIELIWITIIMILLSLVIALLISKQVSKSLIRINESAKKMAEGDLEVCFEGNDYREVAELSGTLNVTAAELYKNERLRQELIANVSHDLRTPLTMIIAYAEVMRDLPGENSPENVQVVIDEAERLTNLVNDMLDISKLQAGVMEIHTAVYCLTESIQSVLERYNKLKEQDGYIISFEYESMVSVEADEYKIFQVIYNLINNAVNYTGPDKTVWVRQRIHEDSVRIEVTDTGEGIAPEALPYVWDRYYKVDKTHKRAVMGTGLGLSIVKNILEIHKAAYGVESVEGKGSTFWFELKMIEQQEPRKHRADV